jgi:hypothetical protein
VARIGHRVGAGEVAPARAAGLVHITFATQSSPK